MRKSIFEKLSAFQSEMKAPKNLINSFGNYKYRNCEGILEAAKPLLKEHGLILILSDKVQEIGGRVYVEATATIYDTESGESISNTALAADSGEKKGMDPAQVTGSASSYARKYALNGLFLLDDTKDADTDEYVKAAAGNASGNDSSQKSSGATQSRQPAASQRSGSTWYSTNDGAMMNTQAQQPRQPQQRTRVPR